MRKPNARERILEAAGRLFHERGYSEVGVNEIIAEADTAKASFYQHFPSKEALCESWLESVHDKSVSHHRELIESDRTPREKVEVYFDELGTFLVARKFRGCPYSNTNAVVDEGCAGIVARIREHKESILHFFRAVAAQQFEGEAARCLADRLFVLYSGATTEAQNLRDLWPVNVAKLLAVELIESNH